MAIGVADVIIKIALYYFHERLWYHSRFGVVDDDHKSEYKPLFKKKIKVQEAKITIKSDS